MRLSIAIKIAIKNAKDRLINGTLSLAFCVSIVKFSERNKNGQTVGNVFPGPKSHDGRLIRSLVTNPYSDN